MTSLRTKQPVPDEDRLASLSLADSAFFFDVDGTLLELRPRPEDVVADELLRDLITRLQSRVQGAVALVSGRSIADLDRIFAPLQLPASGLHGSQVRLPGGETREVSGSVMDHARPDVSRFVAEHEGLRLEDKGATLAVHFRDRPDLGASVLGFLTTFAPGDGVAVQEGKMVVELKPALYDKGTAIGTLMRHPPFAGRLPVFYGDDLTDEAAFAYVNKEGGLSVRIGERHVPTQALAHLDDPAAMRAHLHDLAVAHPDPLADAPPAGDRA